MKKLTILLILTISTLTIAQDQLRTKWQKMHDTKAQSLEKFNEAKFGLFIHWGIYSNPAGTWKGQKIPGIGEWIMYKAQIPREEYKTLCPKFNPTKFNAKQWVKLAKQAGMKYIVAMPKHHDGFAMYDSKVTEYDIIDATPFKRDPMRELYDQCKKQKLRFGFYYSQAVDWMDGGDAGIAEYLKTNPNLENLWPRNTWDPAPITYRQYIEQKAKPQITELLQKFPDTMEVWYDMSQRSSQDISYDFYELVYNLQPKCLVNSRVGHNFGDYWIPGDNAIPTHIDRNKKMYWETPGTLNNTWGYKSYDNDWKKPDELIFWLVDIVSKGGNYLLNIGPKGDGTIPEESIDALKQVGKWLKINGDAIYATSQWIISTEGPDYKTIQSTGHREKEGFTAKFNHQNFWFTEKDNNIYVIALKYPPNHKIEIKAFAKNNQKTKNLKIKSIKLLGSTKKPTYTREEKALKINLPKKQPSKYGYALKITLE